MKLPCRSEHNRVCVQVGISKNNCDKTNRWMDSPSQTIGSRHRSENHDVSKCIEFALKAKKPNNQLERFAACIIHLEVDEINPNKRKKR